MRHRNDPRSSHGEEESRPKRPEFWCLEDGQQGGGYGGPAQERYDGEVEEAEGGFAEEGVVDRRVEGGGDEGGYSGVVQAKHNVGELAGVAGEEMAGAASEKAEHGAPQKDEERPS